MAPQASRGKTFDDEGVKAALLTAVSGEVRKVPGKEKKLIRGQALFAVLRRSSQFSIMAKGLEAAWCVGPQPTVWWRSGTKELPK